MRNTTSLVLAISILSAGLTGARAEDDPAQLQRPEPTGEGASARLPFISVPREHRAVARDSVATDIGTRDTVALRTDRSRQRRVDARTVPEGLRGLIARHAQENAIPQHLVEAVARVESSFNPSARNGPYMGLMQIHPRTARGIGYQGGPSGLLDPDTNLRYGVRYLAQAYRLAGGDTCRTVMKYQGGHGANVMTGANRAYCNKVHQHVASR